MAETTPAQFAAAKRAVVVAPAGCGKTELIVRAIASAPHERDLVLTHTHAGLRAVKDRLRRFQIDRRRAPIETIAGWCLRLAANYPSLSGVPTLQPTSDEWPSIYAAARATLNVKAIRAMIANSYTGIYVDEYQDCTTEQHALVVALAELLPCRVVGDPLQSIFNFGKENVVQWDKEVLSFFEELPGLETPWRWKKSNPALGEWLLAIRPHLLRGEPINLSGAPVQRIASQSGAALAACKVLMGGGDKATVVAIGRFGGACHAFAKNAHGFYGLEPVECPDLLKWSETVDCGDARARAMAAIDLIVGCFSGIPELKNDKTVYAAGAIPKVVKGKLVDIRRSLIALAATGTMDDLARVLDLVTATKQQHQGRLFRPELWADAVKSTKGLAVGKVGTLRESAWKRRDYVRNNGKKNSRFSVGRPLLIKGLEFDHAVVLGGDTVGFNREELYVALTRASASLTIATETSSLTPRPSGIGSKVRSTKNGA